MAACTSTAVAAEAGVSTGTFYGYFEDRSAALAELFAERLDEIVAGVEAALTADRLLDDGLRAAIEAAVGATIEGYRRHAPVLRAALATVQADEAVRAVYWDRHARSVELVRRFLRRGAAAGLIRGEGHTSLAQTLLLLLQALNSPIVLSGTNRRLVSGVRRDVVDAIVAILSAEDPTGR